MGMFGNMGGMPLFALGAGILGGRDLNDGLSRGAQMMMPMMQQRADQQQFAQQVQSLPGLTDQQRQGMMFAGPEMGRKAYASKMFADRPWWAGPNGQVDPAMMAYRQAGRPQTNVNVAGGKMESEYDKKIGGELATTFVESQKAAGTAQRSLQNLKALDVAIQDPNLYTGTGGNAVQALKKAAGSLFGINVSGVGTGELVQTVAKEIALNNKDKLPGPMSNSDREFLVSMAPGLANTPEGNRSIIQLGMLSKRYEIDRAKLAREFAARNGGRLTTAFYGELERLDAQYAQQFGGFMEQIRGMAPVRQRPPTVGTPLDALRQKYQGLE